MYFLVTKHISLIIMYINCIGQDVSDISRSTVQFFYMGGGMARHKCKEREREVQYIIYCKYRFYYVSGSN